MKKLLLCALFLSLSFSWANSDHDHEEEGKHTEDSKSHDVGEEKGHDDDDHHEEQKLPGGVTFFEDETGEFTLKEKVIQNFGIETMALSKNESYIELPEKAIVRSLKATSIFILENERFKSIPVKIISVSSGMARVSTEKKVTRVVVKGNNFLQTILLSLEEGPSEGHGH